MKIAPLVRIPIGVIVERCKANSPWCEFTWRPTAVLGGLPDADPWTQLAEFERTFEKRKRNRADPEALARRGPQYRSGDE